MVQKLNVVIRIHIGGSMKVILFSAVILSLLSSVMPLPVAMAAEHAVTVGYGFGAFNTNKRTMKIEGGRSYDFFQVSYLYEKPSRYPNVAAFFEPFAAYVNRPETGADIGFNAGIKWYPFGSSTGGLYFGPQIGAAYTTIKFEEQGTHLLFILQATLGFRYKNLFIEDRFKHYSNGATASPNRSVHSNIIVVGMYF